VTIVCQICRSYKIGNKIQFVIYSDNGALLQKLTTFVTVLNTLYNVIVTDDGTGTIAGLNIYLNGVLQTTTNTVAGTYLKRPLGTTPMLFGKLYAGTTGYGLNGMLDELYIFNSVISVDEIIYVIETPEVSRVKVRKVDLEKEIEQIDREVTLKEERKVQIQDYLKEINKL